MFDNMSMAEIIKLLFPLILIQFTLAVFCLFKLVKDRAKYIPKWAWALIIIFINLFGPIIYLIVGRERD